MSSLVYSVYPFPRNYQLSRNSFDIFTPCLSSDSFAASAVASASAFAPHAALARLWVVERSDSKHGPDKAAAAKELYTLAVQSHVLIQLLCPNSNVSMIIIDLCQFQETSIRRRWYFWQSSSLRFQIRGELPAKHQARPSKHLKTSGARHSQQSTCEWRGRTTRDLLALVELTCGPHQPLVLLGSSP